MYDLYTLKNKANVILIPQADTQSVTVLVMYPVGSRYEQEKMSGVSHYIEHLMFKGTKKRPSTLVLTREIDRLGAEYNAFTGKEYTAYYIKTDAKFTEVALDILSDMLFNSLFDPKEMEREKGPIIEELRMYKDNPVMRIDSLFEDLFYAGCPLGRDIGGTEKHVSSYKRPAVLDYREKYYCPSNMTLVIAGRMPDTVRHLVENYFGQQNGRKTPSRSFSPFCFGPGKREERLIVERKHTDQVQMMLGFPGFTHTAETNPAVAVLNTIFGGSMSSRLFIQIRERRGLAYMIRSGDERFRDTGYVYVRAGLEAKNINKAVAVVGQEINKILAKGISRRELEDAKTHIRGAVTLSMEDSGAQANWYASQFLFFPKMETPEEKLKKIEQVSRADVQGIAKKIFDWEKVRVAVVGDVEKESIKF